jgi:hypothetical protein
MLTRKNLQEFDSENYISHGFLMNDLEANKIVLGLKELALKGKKDNY